MEIVLEESDSSAEPFKVPKKIRVLLKKKLSKKVLLEELIKLKASLSGIPGENVQKLYEQLGLDALSRHQMNSRRWYIKVKGIQELAVMNQYAASLSILNLTNHRHSLVRMEAQTALVRLQKYKGLSFLNMLNYTLSEWHQINLLQLLSHHPVAGVNGISNWLHSCNASVVQFTLRLIGELHAEEFCEEAIRCLEDNDILVRKSAIMCLGEILSTAAIEALKKHFSSEKNQELRLCIMNQVLKTGSESELKFFIDLHLNEDAEIRQASQNTILYLLKNKNSIVAA